MIERQHDAITKWERRWLAASGLISLLFIIFIAYSLAIEGAHIAQGSGRTSPEQLLDSGSFANPGVLELSNNKFQVTLVAQMFSFQPSEVILPVGAEVTFFMTSKDVLHGYQIQNTNVNVELIPGEVSYLKYVFDKEGQHRITCNEYCGLAHQNMVSKLLIVSEDEYYGTIENKGTESKSAEAVSNSNLEDVQNKETIKEITVEADGEKVYLNNCAACHQANGEGLPSAFPPLNNHMSQLYLVDRSYPLKVILYGLQGSVKVLKKPYNGAMPAWSQLSDAEVAAVLNYTLDSWDNPKLLADEGFKPYTVAEVLIGRAESLSAQEVHSLRQELSFE